MNICGLGFIKIQDNQRTDFSGSIKIREKDFIDKYPLKQVRRADNFSKLSVLAAQYAVVDSNIAGVSRDRIGIVLTSSFGPHITTFRFLDNILDYGDTQVSPILFSNSVHNAAASYIAYSLDICGPTISTVSFHQSFITGLFIAEAWLKEKRCDYVLVGACEESGKEIEYVLRFHPELKPTSAWVFLSVSKNKYTKVYCARQALKSMDSLGMVEELLQKSRYHQSIKEGS